MSTQSDSNHLVPDPSRWLGLTLWLSWAAGLAITTALAWQSVDADAAPLPGCGADGECSFVLGSGYSRLLGVSLTTYALVYYAAAGTVLAMSRWMGRRIAGPVLSLLLPVLSSGAVTVGLWGVAIMLFVLQETCPWCLAVHVANAAFFFLAIVGAWSDWRRARKDFPALSARIPVAAAFAAVVLCSWQLTMLLVFADDGRPRVVRIVPLGDYSELRQFDGDPVELLGLADDEAMATFKGRADAPDRLVMLGCYTCPKCQEMNRWLKKIIENRPGRLRVDFRMAPLSGLCNPLMTNKAITRKHRVACAAARAVLAVASVDGEAFTAFSDWLYLHRESMSVEQIMAEGRRRVGTGSFDQAVDSPEVAARLKADVTLARLFQASTVPRLYLRQGQIYGVTSKAILERLLADQFGWPSVLGMRSKP